MNILVNQIGKIWLNYIKGQFVLTVFICVLSYISFKLLGVPYPLVMSIIAGVCENIPTVGPILGGAIAVIFSIIKGSSAFEMNHFLFGLIIAGVCVLIQLAENYLIKPKIIGEAIDINPIILFIGMAAAGAVFNVPGLLLAAPVMASVRDIFQYAFYREDYLKKIEKKELPQP